MQFTDAVNCRRQSNVGAVWDFEQVGVENASSHRPHHQKCRASAWPGWLSGPVTVNHSLNGTIIPTRATAHGKADGGHWRLFDAKADAKLTAPGQELGVDRPTDSRVQIMTNSMRPLATVFGSAELGGVELGCVGRHGAVDYRVCAWQAKLGNFHGGYKRRSRTIYSLHCYSVYDGEFLVFAIKLSYTEHAQVQRFMLFVTTS
jgi:hypothetical protein